MTKPEILDFLELPQGSTDNDIAIRLNNKLIYFLKLLETVSNEFLKKRYQQNIDKIKEIQHQYAIPTQNEYIKEEVKPKKIDTPIHIAKPEIKNNKAEVAWLIKHTEYKSSKSFPLYKGSNYLGRSGIEGEQNILIEDDVYVSRTHAIIQVEDIDPPTFYILDNDVSNKGKASKNGTFINGDERRITQKTRLFKNDTIQIGMTKLVLKLNNDNLNNIIHQVEDSGYMKTVVINIF